MVRILRDKSTTNCLTINPNLLHNYSYSKLCSEIELKYGCSTQTIQIQQSMNVDDNVVLLSEDLIEQFAISTYCNYEIQLNNNKLEIGPYLGILAFPTNHELLRRLNGLKRYVTYYEEIKGAVLAFSFEAINTSSDKIKGFLYNPISNKWEKGEYPLPNSIFNKIPVDTNDKWNYLVKNLGINICNYPTFNKWHMYEWFQHNPKLKDTLPSTQLVDRSNQIYKFIKKYKNAYLKPIGGTFANGIIKLTYNAKFVTASYYKKDKKRHIIKSLNTKKKFNRFLLKFLKSEKYLIQEAIDLIQHNGSIIDFRLIFVKDKEGTWKDLGLFSRFSAKESSVSNINAGGKAFHGDVTLKDALKLSDEQFKLFRNNLSSTCLEAAKELEKHLHHCGNLGFDIGIDKTNQLWIIEINNEDPDHRIAITAKKNHILYQARLFNMLYTKKLAEF
ncbi:YheC/YheD family protein [Bacillus suaedaesalsae]|uniref:YheC/YheD family protein n=1 Tax=Bacillus suaedaesalsae TaxID=2810349 RepID=UPI00194EDE13